MLAACSPTSQGENESHETTRVLDVNPENKRFDDLLNAHWEWQLKSYPVFSTSLGVRDYDENLPDPALSA